MQLREVVKISVKIARNEAKKEIKGEEKDDRTEGSSWVEVDDVTEQLMDSLNLYLPHWQVSPFIRILLGAFSPPQKTFKKPDPSEIYPKWAALIESMNMIDEMRSFISQDQSLVQDQIAAEIHHCFKGRSNKTKKFFMNKNPTEMAWVSWMHWSCPLEHKKRTKEIMKDNDENEQV